MINVLLMVGGLGSPYKLTVGHSDKKDRNIIIT